MTADVTVVMATYNGARFVREQLDSLAAQDHLPRELIVSDDGSSDPTCEIVEEFRRTAPFPLTVRRNEARLGYGENFLSAARLATGEYVAFCDQDDVWHPAKLRTAVEHLDRHRADLFVHTARVIDGAGRATGRRFTQHITGPAVVPPLHLGPWSVYYGCSMVFRRGLLDLVDPAGRGGHTFEYDGLLSHDLWIYFLATSLGTVVLTDTPLVDYRQHQGNATPALGAGARGWLRALGVPADPLLPRSAIAEHRARLLDELGGENGENDGAGGARAATDPAVRSAARRAAPYWWRIARYEEDRLDLYREPRVARRAALLLAAARDGAYRSFPAGGLGGRLMLKDALVGVLPTRQVRGAVQTAASGRLGPLDRRT